MWTPIGSTDNFENGRLVLRIDGEKYPVLVLLVGEEVFAISDVCTHDKNPLSDGELEGCAIKCSRHGAKFDLRTGKATLPAPRPGKVYPAKEEDGQVWLDI